jgi:hypothetical protein
MNDGIRRTAAEQNGTRGRTSKARPDRMAFWAFALAIVAMLAAAATANAASGGVSSGGSGGTSGGEGDTGAHAARYVSIWSGFNRADRHWAHRVSYCESGNDPRAVGGRGTYRGAFMFTLDAWKIPHKSPGGDPIVYPWKTQAVVAVLLKHKMGTKPWPVCG